MGRSKRIVLYDTLLESHGEEEILAVLAHEVGHWKKRHVLRQLLFVEIVSLVGLYAAARFLDWPMLYKTFGFQGTIPYAGLFLIGTGFSLIGYFAHPVEAAISRKFEREADDFSLTLMKEPAPLIAALKRLATENLSNLNPHPLYAWYYYSHPPLAERIERLAKACEKGRTEVKLNLSLKTVLLERFAENTIFPGWSKRPRCKAPAVRRNEVYSEYGGGTMNKGTPQMGSSETGNEGRCVWTE